MQRGTCLPSAVGWHLSKRQTRHGGGGGHYWDKKSICLLDFFLLDILIEFWGSLRGSLKVLEQQVKRIEILKQAKDFRTKLTYI